MRKVAANDFEYPQTKGFSDPYYGDENHVDDKVIHKFGADGLQKHLAGAEIQPPDNHFTSDNERVIMNLPDEYK